MSPIETDVSVATEDEFYGCLLILEYLRDEVLEGGESDLVNEAHYLVQIHRERINQEVLHE
jgi:hypothetical protein